MQATRHLLNGRRKRALIVALVVLSAFLGISESAYACYPSDVGGGTSSRRCLVAIERPVIPFAGNDEQCGW